SHRRAPAGPARRGETGRLGTDRMTGAPSGGALTAIEIPDATAEPAAYVRALLDTLGDRDPLEVYETTAGQVRRLCQDLAAGPPRSGMFRSAQVSVTLRRSSGTSSMSTSSTDSGSGSCSPKRNPYTPDTRRSSGRNFHIPSPLSLSACSPGCGRITPRCSAAPRTTDGSGGGPTVSRAVSSSACWSPRPPGMTWLISINSPAPSPSRPGRTPAPPHAETKDECPVPAGRR